MSNSWYSIKIMNSSNLNKLFDGYLKVNNTTNLIIAMYETINGTTDFNNNILISTGTGVYDSLNSEGFPVYNYNGALYDNAYKSTWKQFDYWGIIIKSMSNYPQYNFFNFFCVNEGDQNINNIGYIYNNYFNQLSIFEINLITTPISNICFPKGTPILTDQGEIPIDEINPDIHTISNMRIVYITKTKNLDDYLICFEKNSLGKNYPSEKTIMSRYHQVYHNRKMISAEDFINQSPKNIYKVKKNDEEILYNVLMENHNFINVNNMICETLHPENEIAKLFLKMNDF